MPRCCGMSAALSLQVYWSARIATPLLRSRHSVPSHRLVDTWWCIALA